MPKTIDYPRTTYQSAWEVAEVVDDTGGKCSFETCARKLNRKVSGSFKAIIGSAVKFGLLTSKRELLTTTNLFRRIKHAYDKQEELLYHREAFLHPPLFNQICRKFRNRELPVHMFDIMLIREFGVEEINAQNVAKAFVDGARMAGVMDERNIIADIDLLANQQGPRKELAPGEMPLNLFRATDKTPDTGGTTVTSPTSAQNITPPLDPLTLGSTPGISTGSDFIPAAFRGSASTTTAEDPDPVSALFGLHPKPTLPTPPESPSFPASPSPPSVAGEQEQPRVAASLPQPAPTSAGAPPHLPDSPDTTPGYLLRISGPGIDTQLHIQDTDDLEIARFLLDKIRKQLSS
ncbi:hypothetical protein SAMN02746009_03314 [Hymenobacter psychrotolerans DSM 18569]|uniref:Uncharacterized protein n=2 Tax=Hymenobacter psychrotolerans TaxID=344998 RepID=A0A1M7D660_9BACT|nr:hypothetical protein SAMN02746009_03314 [Hymenobacter psychrotolerans DSM 18569]